LQRGEFPVSLREAGDPGTGMAVADQLVQEEYDGMDSAGEVKAQDRPSNVTAARLA
jgi:hypothetical protein